MASEYTPNRRYPLYVATDKPNLRDQYNGAIRNIDTDMKQALDDSSGVASALGSGFDAQHTVRMAIESVSGSIGSGFDSTDTVRKAIDNINGSIGSGFSAQNTIKNAIDSINNSIGSGFSAQNTVKSAIDGLGDDIDDVSALIGSGFSPTSTISSQLATERGRINSLTQRLDGIASYLRDKHILVLGDSYAQGVHSAGATTNGINWMDVLESTLDLQHLHKYKAGSAGFIARSTSTSGSESTVPTGTTYSEVLLYAYNHLNSIGVADKVEHIVIQGGVNDGSQTDVYPVQSAIASCVSQLRENFPNAAIHIVYACLGHTEFNSMVRRAFLIPDLYNQACIYSGAQYSQFTNAPWLFGDAAVSHDHSHPTEELQRYLAKFIANVLVSGSYPDLSGYRQDSDTNGNTIQFNITPDHYLKTIGSFRATTNADWSQQVQPIVYGPDTRLIAYGGGFNFVSVYNTPGVTGAGIFMHNGDNGTIQWIAKAQTSTAHSTINWVNYDFSRRIG